MGDGLPKMARIAGTAMRSFWSRMKHIARSGEFINGSWSSILKYDKLLLSFIKKITKFVLIYFLNVP